MRSMDKPRVVDGEILKPPAHSSDALSKQTEIHRPSALPANTIPARRTTPRLLAVLSVVGGLFLGSVTYTLVQKSQNEAISKRNDKLEESVSLQAREIDRLNNMLRSARKMESERMGNIDERQGGPAAIVISPGSRVVDFKLSNNTSVGAPLLVADGATIEGLTMSINKVYGADHAVRLGDVFGAKIDQLYLDTRFPIGAVKEIVAAGATAETKASFKERMKDIITDPAQLTAYYTLAEKIWQAGKPLIGF